ncbi:MAG TPA: hypothetical protein VF753_12710 [Terriglobales bacterium]
MSGPVGPQEKFGVYVISIIGVSIQKLRDDARYADISPDGSQIVFADYNTKDLWVMNADGSQSRSFLKPEPGVQLYQPTWSPNGRRIFYVKYHEENGKPTILLESRNADASDPVLLLSNGNLVSYSRAQPGRLVLAMSEPPPNQRSSNLWEIRYDPSTGKPEGPERRLTDWPEYRFSRISMTADGKTLAFLYLKWLSNVYIGKLGPNATTMEQPQGLTANQRKNWATAWTSDGKSVLYYSDMAGGSFDLYRQAIDSHNPEKLTSGPDDKWAPQLSPDGKWILYLSWPKPAPGADPPPGKLVRMPASGGPSEFVADLKGHPFAGTTRGGFPTFNCPRTGTNCVLAELTGENQITFTSIDPSAGRRNEITKFAGDPYYTSWNISPDGSQIAVNTFDYKTGDLQIIPVNGGAPQKFSLLPVQELGPIAFTPDGKSFYIGSFSSRGSTLYRYDPGKTPTALWKSVWDIEHLVSSPDGQHLAIAPDIYDANAWIIPNFPAR